MNTGIFLIKILAALLCLVPYATASTEQNISQSSINKHCFSCHAKKGAEKRFLEGDSVSVYINPQAFEKSVHKSLSCTSCHQEFSQTYHPDRVFRNRLQYSVKASHKCLDCHPKKSLRFRTVHEALFKKEKEGSALVCTNCHSAHAGARVSGGTIATSEEVYCMKCHSKDNTMQFKNGKTVSTKVHTDSLRRSVHGNLSCTDCHFGFSPDDHPRRRFRSEREYRLSSFDVCRRCHYDKYSQVSNSIHYTLISSGRLNAPTCVDCHGGHEISSARRSRISIVRMCEKCHTDAYGLYSKSVHGAPLLSKNNKDTPVCIDCHSSHNIKATASSDFHDSIPYKCSNCHADKTLMGRYGLSTDVVKTYLSDFHGVTLELYRKQGQKRAKESLQMAVCTDCHGSHDIIPFSGHDMQVIKSRLLKRCQACHTEATENFPDAWLLHYKPSLAATPVLFLTEWFYKILLVIFVVGLLFQVLLDIYRHIRNR